MLHGLASFEEEAPDEAEMRRRFHSYRDAGFPYLAAELGGDLVGYAYAGQYRPRPGFVTSEELPDEIVLPNGKVIRYLPLSEYLAMKEEGKEGGRFGGRRKAAAAARKADDAAPAETFTRVWKSKRMNPTPLHLLLLL